MDDTKKMLRAIINGQSALKSELLGEIKKVSADLNNHRQETKNGFEKVTARIDKIGKQLAYLEDDTPTSEEYDSLESE